MNPPSSSTSSSERAAEAAARTDVWKTGVWLLLWLLVFELAVVTVFTVTPWKAGALRNYLWYGESYEAKLRALVDKPNPSPRSILFAGWVTPEQLAGGPTDVDVTVYGSSFAGNLASALSQQAPDLSLRLAVGPGSPLNHSFGTWEIDRGLRQTNAVIIGVVADAVGEVLVMNRGSLYPDFPMPYFFPRYDVQDGKLVRTGESPIRSADALRRAFHEEPALWQRQLDVLAQHDAAHRPWLFSADAADHSAIGRLLRRAVAKRHLDDWLGSVHTPRGFVRDSETVTVFRALLQEMVRGVRAEGAKPIIVLFATRGYDDHLRELVQDLLDAEQVTYVNSHSLCPATDSRSFRPDGHLTAECDAKVAAAVLPLLR